MRKSILMPTLTLIVMLLVFTGCATNKGAVQVKEVPNMTLTEKGVSVTMDYLPKAELIAKFGEDNNPFIPPAYSASFNQGMAFELSVRSEVRGEIYLKNLELHTGGRPENPKNSFHLTTFWENKLRRGPQQGYSMGRLKLKIKKYMLPTIVKLDPGSSQTGVVIFLGKIPRYGNFSLFVPVLDDKGGTINNFRFDFEL
jgi:hypothetical protein